MTTSILGNRVQRTEDPRFLTVGGTYADDLRDERLAGAVHLTYVRSTVAHARIEAVHVDEARTAPGVVAVYTADDVDVAPLDPDPPLLPPTMVRPMLATGVVRFVGEPVALVVSETRTQGVDAAEQVWVDYDPLPAVVDPEEAALDEVVIHPEAGTNVAFALNAEPGDELFEACEVVVTEKVLNQRLAPAPLEVRSGAAAWHEGRLVQWVSSQAPHGARTLLAKVHGLEPAQVHVIAPDVGGGFGAKVGLTPEEVLLGWVAKQLGRPARWTETRTENLQAMGHGRGQQQTVTIGGRRDGTIEAYRLDILQDSGVTDIMDELNPSPRLLMGPGPVNTDPRVLRAMSMPLLGQFDAEFTGYMNDVMALLRQLFQTQNEWALLVNGTARAGIEAALVSLLEPGDRVLVPIFGRFGHLLCEVARRCGADVRPIETEWGTVFDPQQIESAIEQHQPSVVAVVHGDTSTTMAQPLDELGAICRRYDALLYVDATATLGGMPVSVDAWQLDIVSAGLQKCLSGPAGSAPLTFNERVVEVVKRRKHIEQGIQPEGFVPGVGTPIQSNYFDLCMLMDYWSPQRLNHHTEASSMLYAARECARLVLQEGLNACFARHALASRAITTGLQAMGLELFGDQRHKMANVTGVVIPPGIEGDAIRHSLLQDYGIEIGTSFGPLHGRIWRIGAMGYACRKPNVLHCLGALEATLRQHGFPLCSGAAVDAALQVYRDAGR